MKHFNEFESLLNQYEAEIRRLNDDYNKAFERLKAQQREIDRLKEENEFLSRTDNERYQEAEATIRASIANAGTSCHWCEDVIRKNTAKEIMLLLGKGYDETRRTDFKDLEWYKSFCRELNIRYGMEEE